LIDQTLLEILAVNRDELMQSSNSALKILAIIHKSYPEIWDEECILSISLNDSIVRMLFHADYAKAISISQGVLDRFPDSKFPYFVSRHLAVIGRCLTLSGGKYAEAENSLLKALDMSSSDLTDDTESKRVSAEILHDLAMNTMMSGGDDVQAIKYLEQALVMLQNTNFEARKAVCLMGLGNIMYSRDDVHEALDYYLKAEFIFDELSNFSNWASVDSNIGLCHMQLNNLQLAEKYLNRSLNLRRKIGNSDEIAISCFNLSLLYERKGNIEKAILHLLACRSNASRSVNKKMYNDAVARLDDLAPKRSQDYEALFAQNGELRSYLV
jgi:tetratricopeptide (TPR) repeat protein